MPSDRAQHEAGTIVFRWGEGRISGWLSAALGLMNLGGVACFRYPHLLTTPDLVARVNVESLRLLMLVTLVVSFVMGLVSHVYDASRRSSKIGLAASSLAVLLGGANVEAGARPALSVTSLGLDVLILGLLFYSLLFIPLEMAFPRRRQPILRAEWRTDFGYFVMTNLLVSILMAATTGGSRLLFGWAQVPGLQSRIAAQPGWLQFLEMVLIADLAQYAVHRLFHKVPALWRIHAVHHSIEAVDWLAGSRLHLFEVLFTRSAVFLPLWLLGFSETVLYAYIGFVALHAVFIHANIGINFGWLRLVLATPQFHHWHHSDDPKVMDRNFAVHLPIIDRLFGTHYQPAGEWPKSYGLIGENMPDGILAQHLYPFRRRKRKGDGAVT